MNVPRKTIIFLPDGMADEPIAELGGKTPLQAAKTPGMDFIARKGRSGTLLTLPEGFPTSSDVANMSVLGCDLKTEYCGRAVLEAASQGIPLGPHDVALRCNLVTVGDDGRLLDFSGGHIAQAAAEEIIAWLNARLATDRIRFHSGVSYRNLLILSGSEFSPKVYCEKPDDNYGSVVAEHLPRLEAGAEEGRVTLETILDLTAKAAALLPEAPANLRAVAEGRAPANGIWLWAPGAAGAMRTLAQRHGITAAGDLRRGRHQRPRPLPSHGRDQSPGATGYIDTNYEGKAQAAIGAIETHTSSTSTSRRSTRYRTNATSRSSSRPSRTSTRRSSAGAASCGDSVTYAVLPDHPVPLAMGKHTRTPVPVAICGPGLEPDGVQTFDEFAAPRGALGALFGPELMEFLFSGDKAK